MKLNKKVFMASMLLGMIAPLAGCEPKDDRIQVNFWHTMGKTIIARLTPMIEDFEAKNPDIHIIQTPQGGYGDIKTKIETAIAAGDVPTMAFCYPDHVANYLTSNAVVKLDEYIDSETLGFTEEDGLVDDFIEAYWNEGKSYDVEGTYSVPFYKSTEVMFYNKTEFNKYGWQVPTTWAELETLCATIKATAGHEEDTPFGYDSDANLFITMCEQYGIPYTTNTNVVNPEDHFLFKNDQAKAMVERIKGWYTNKWFTSQGTNADGSYTSTLFKDKKLLMTIGSTGGTSYNYSDNFEIGVARIPGAEATVEGGNNHVIMQGPSICFFRRQTPEQKEAAWKFYKYCVNAINGADFASVTGYSPSRRSSFDTDFWQDFMDSDLTGSDALVRTTVDFNANLMDSYFVSPTFKGSATARDEVGGTISTFCTGAKTLDEAFNDAFDNCVFAA